MDDSEELAALRRLAELEARAGDIVPQNQGILGRLQAAGLAVPVAAQTRMQSVMGNAAKSAIPGIADMFLNAPVNAWNLSKAAGGTALHALGVTKDLPVLSETPDYARRLSEAMRFTSPQEAPQNAAERLAAAGAQGATGGAMGGLPGAVVGGISGLVGQGVSELTDNPAMGSVAGMATYPAAGAAANYGRQQMLAAQAEQLRRQPAIDTMTKLRDAGLTIPPTTTNPTGASGFVNRLLESIGGKAPTGQQASLRNEPVAGRIVREQLNAPAHMPITDATLEQLRDRAAAPYREIEALPGLPASGPPMIHTQAGPWPQAPSTPAELINEWRRLNDRSRRLWRDSQVPGGSTAAHDEYVATRQRADAIEQQIEAAASAAGRPALVSELRKARPKIAQIHDVERAANTDLGTLNARDLARARARGVPLSGGLETVAQLGESYPKAAQDVSQIGSPATNQLLPWLGGLGGGVMGAGYGAHTALGPEAMHSISSMGVPAIAGTAAGLVAAVAAPALARQLILSRPYQRYMGTPNYRAGAISRNLAEAPPTGPGELALRNYLLAQQLREQGQQP